MQRWNWMTYSTGSFAMTGRDTTPEQRLCRRIALRNLRIRELKRVVRELNNETLRLKRLITAHNRSCSPECYEIQV